jgi:hypothetical protein
MKALFGPETSDISRTQSAYMGFVEAGHEESKTITTHRNRHLRIYLLVVPYYDAHYPHSVKKMNAVSI